MYNLPMTTYNLNRYEEVLKYIYRMLPMYQRQGKSAFKKDLNNIIALCEYLGNPHEEIKTIHVAGTNGKGSVSHLLSFFLMIHGYKTGLYTSPHYKDFRERIKINGEMCSKQYVKDFIRRIEPVIPVIQPSFFEITVAMAFQYFKQREVDYAVVEVGLGGRLDSTNILHPLLSVITNISLDHVEMLGDTIPKIAFEKAGIIKPDTPVVIGETQADTTPTFYAKAEECKAPILWADEAYHLEELSDLGSTKKYVFKKRNHSIFTFETDLVGPFQDRNLLTALASFDQLPLEKNYQLIADQMLKFQLRSNYLGRWQKIAENPDILVDSAHNEGGMKYLKSFLSGDQSRNLHIVLGVVNDKDLDSMFPNFPAKATYYFAKADIPRGLPADTLRAKAVSYGLQGRSYSSVRKALAAAKTKAKPADLIFVGGSIFTVAEVL